ncbi:RimJ/RimL family protein N-acetyltransferase [Paenibacillus baekrokdamisoli]|uniref:GNAT family N-acetyltransferase n=1 Tax=Paenibacillus baekrokdamisoli TaxID=1712516 RepID=UPI00161C55A5|nr:GNAT family N-acetyltransferase [Paenibacillus baekrokdamisoli]MBB3072463.1 RimJ/RimL family protein N-acetyltransferase [Paenibacillus baekrokdamisoli]
MIQLSNCDYKDIIGVVKDKFHFHNVFVYSVLELNQPGTVFVNSKTDPTAGIIMNRGGCYYVFGDLSDSNFNNSLIAFLQDRSNHANFYDLYSSSVDWHLFLESALRGEVVQLTRSHYVLDDYDQSNCNTELPAGFQISKIDKKYYNDYRTQIDNTYDLLWESDDDYLQNAFGFSIIGSNGEFASVCNTFFIGGGFIAPDILTLEKYRNMGLASIVCTHFIQRSRSLGLKPYWDCDAGNEASNRLVKRLGFVKVGDLPILWWHENKDVISNYLKKNNYSKG